MGKNKIPETGIYDARQLGRGRMLLLGFQHMFAMFGATILVPILTGLDVSNTLLFAGLGTLLFHLITGGKVPAFLGSSFAFLGGFQAVANLDAGKFATMTGEEKLPYAMGGVVVAGLLYLVLALLFKLVGAKKVTGEEDILLVSDDGTIIRMEAGSISLLGRATQGVRLMRPAEGAHVVAMARTEREASEEETAEPGESAVEITEE